MRLPHGVSLCLHHLSTLAQTKRRKPLRARSLVPTGESLALASRLVHVLVCDLDRPQQDDEEGEEQQTVEQEREIDVHSGVSFQMVGVTIALVYHASLDK